MKKIINLFLLAVMFFTITHEVVYAQHTDKHCNIEEYVAEFSMFDVHLDEHEHKVCESHCMFHISFLLPDRLSLYEIEQNTSVLALLASKNHFLYQKNTFRPPIV